MCAVHLQCNTVLKGARQLGARWARRRRPLPPLGLHPFVCFRLVTSHKCATSCVFDVTADSDSASDSPARPDHSWLRRIARAPKAKAEGSGRGHDPYTRLELSTGNVAVPSAPTGSQRPRLPRRLPLRGPAPIWHVGWEAHLWATGRDIVRAADPRDAAASTPCEPHPRGQVSLGGTQSAKQTRRPRVRACRRPLERHKRPPCPPWETAGETRARAAERREGNRAHIPTRMAHPAQPEGHGRLGRLTGPRQAASSCSHRGSPCRTRRGRRSS